MGEDKHRRQPALQVFRKQGGVVLPQKTVPEEAVAVQAAPADSEEGMLQRLRQEASQFQAQQRGSQASCSKENAERQLQQLSANG